MNRWLGLVVLCCMFLIISGVAQAQTAVTTTGGTANSVPKFSGNATLVNSAITESNGSVGIGTSSPTAKLEVTAGYVSGDNQVYNALMVRPDSGSGGFGGNGASILLGSRTNHGVDPVAGIWSALGNGGDGGVNYSGFLVLGTTRMGSAAPTEAARVDDNGNVGIGTTSPGSRLEVNGNVKLTSGSGASLTFADGTVQSTAWTGSLCGGDYAESVNVTGERPQYEPGDVLVIDPAHPGQFLKSSSRYSRLVAGIYSTKPGLVGRRQTTDPNLSSTEVPMAMVGIVPAKVTDENGPIEVGDLLVSSSLPAHAMKGGDGVLPTGTVIGKALGSLASGTGVIEVLVSLQ